MTKKTLSTFEKEMQDGAFKEKFEAEYREFVLSEILLELMENAHKTVRSLAKETGLSPTVIQKMRSGLQEDVKLGNFMNISRACGYKIILENNENKDRITL